jgi:hypothetical protein
MMALATECQCVRGDEKNMNNASRHRERWQLTKFFAGEQVPPSPPGFFFPILSSRWPSSTGGMSQIWVEVRQERRFFLESCLVLVTDRNLLSKHDFFPLKI